MPNYGYFGHDWEWGMKQIPDCVHGVNIRYSVESYVLTTFTKLSTPIFGYGSILYIEPSKHIQTRNVYLFLHEFGYDGEW